MAAPSCKTAILFCHGIVGTPRHFDFLLPEVPPDWTVRNLCLPGHGGTVQDFSRSSLQQWQQCYQTALSDLLKTHDRVLLCGHSMGTLFALQACSHVSAPGGTICGLFLLAVPLGACLRLPAITNCLKYALGLVREDDVLAAATQRAAGVSPEKKLWRYLPWIPRFLELFHLIRSTQKVLHLVNVPGIAFQSAQDELVSRKAPARLQKATDLTVEVLPGSAHFYLAPEDKDRVVEQFRSFLNLYV